MAGAFSGHLVDSYNANQARHSTPFTTSGSPIVTTGSMSFSPQMHGTSNFSNQSMADTSFSLKSEPSFFESGLSDATTHKIAALQAKLNQKLGPEFISQRPGPAGGPKLTYAEGWKIINLANEVFGFNGWSSSVVSLTTDFIDFNEETKRYTVGTTAIMRVTLRDGVFHEDIGYGMLENSKSKGQALDKCKKEAVTDGLKRALRNFGNLLGNCLYDKSYTQEVIKIKVPPPKFDKNDLHRRPEFEERKPDLTATSAATTTLSSNLPPDVKPNIMITPVKPPVAQPQPPSKILSSVPAHMRSEPHASGTFSGAQNNSPMHDATTPALKDRAPTPTGLNTPITTPAHGSTSSTSRQSNPAAPPKTPPERERKVSFAPPNATTNNNANLAANKPMTSSTTRKNKPSPPPPPPAKPNQELTDPDDSYHFCSDDDAFLALVDLGDGDLGQPVSEEADLGRPIDGEDDDGDVRTPICWGDEGSGAEDATFGAGSSGNGNGGADVGKKLNVERGQGTSEGASGLGILSKLLPQNQLGLNNNGHRLPSLVLSRNLPQHRQQQNQNQNQHRQPNYPPPKNQNRPPAQMPTAPGSSSTAKRSVTPSMGGFHFPPGIDSHPQLQARPPPPQGNRQTSTSTSGSGIGLKRPLDTMSGSSYPNMGPRRPGMGLDPHSDSGAAHVKREVFGQLEVGEGGKRMRR